MSTEVNELSSTVLMHHPSLAQAYELAATLHEKQTRPGAQGREPYILHPLRNTLRLIEWGVTDLDLLTASLLHDTVEDCAIYYAELEGLVMEEEDARVLLLGHIETVFGSVVKQYVFAVTNPLAPLGQPELTKAEKHHGYQVAVRAHIQEDAAVLLIKLADWLDNAGNLALLPPNKRAMAVSLASKYEPLAGDFIVELSKENRFLASTEVEAIIHRVAAVERELEELLK